ncbi:spore germination protein GerPC [Siminovitchia sediminis]|uniref:Spore germination protein GerPC n=1 Tax=Siminovitchia sediminis TaxID=1274353 RepID=A0ABW4KMI4_9BACI
MQTYTIHQLYAFLESQQKEIARLKRSLHDLSIELKQLKEKPSVTVERLEYKFDQLKVETLEGTLNIGINPSDLNDIEDLSIPENSQTNIAVRHPELYERTLKKLHHYIDHELETIIKNAESQKVKSLDEPYIQMIKEDIRKQVPARIDHYLKLFSSHVRSEEIKEELFDKVYQTLLADMNRAINEFLSKMPQHEGGTDLNGAERSEP